MNSCSFYRLLVSMPCPVLSFPSQLFNLMLPTRNFTSLHQLLTPRLYYRHCITVIIITALIKSQFTGSLEFTVLFPRRTITSWFTHDGANNCLIIILLSYTMTTVTSTLYWFMTSL